MAWLRRWLRQWLVGDFLARLEALDARLCCLDGRGMGAPAAPHRTPAPQRAPMTFTMEHRQ